MKSLTLGTLDNTSRIRSHFRKQGYVLIVRKRDQSDSIHHQHSLWQKETDVEGTDAGATAGDCVWRRLDKCRIGRTCRFPAPEYSAARLMAVPNDGVEAEPYGLFYTAPQRFNEQVERMEFMPGYYEGKSHWAPGRFDDLRFEGSGAPR